MHHFALPLVPTKVKADQLKIYTSYRLGFAVWAALRHGSFLVSDGGQAPLPLATIAELALQRSILFYLINLNAADIVYLEAKVIERGRKARTTVQDGEAYDAIADVSSC